MAASSVVQRFRILVVGALVAGACTTAEPTAERFTVRDSAGVTIAESAQPALDGSAAWSIDSVAALRIGTVDGAEPYVFGRVWDATRFPDGRIAVVDELAMEIRLFDPAGEHLLTVGRAGGGPGEFGGPLLIRATDDDTVVAWDGGHTRLSWFTADGELIEQVSLREQLSQLGVLPFRNGRVWEIDRSGTLLSTGRVRPERVEGLRDTDRRLALFQERGTVSHDLGRVPAGQSFVVRLDRMSIGIGNPYAPSVTAALAGPARVAIGGERQWEVRLVAPDGTLRRILRAAIPRAPVTAALERAGLEMARDMAARSPLSLARAEEAYGEIPLPDSVPAVGPIVAAGDALWVGRRTGSWWEVSDYDVFDADGRWVSTVIMPTEVERVLEIGSDYVLARVVDELDVQYVHMYRIRRGG